MFVTCSKCGCLALLPLQLPAVVLVCRGSRQHFYSLQTGLHNIDQLGVTCMLNFIRCASITAVAVIHHCSRSDTSMMIVAALTACACERLVTLVWCTAPNGHQCMSNETVAALLFM